MQVLICLPIKDEEKILRKNVEILMSFLNKKNWPFTYQIALMINGSTDKSRSIAEKLSEKYKNELKVLEIKEGGKGRAIKYCFDSFLDKDVLVYMDADLAVSLENLKDLIMPIVKNEADFVLGSRMLKNSKTNRSIYRSYTSNIYNYLTKILFSHNLTDFQCGFKAIKSNVYKTIRPQLKHDSWFFDTEWIILALSNNFKLKEVAVNWQDNRYIKRKSSVMTIKLGLIFFKNLIKLKLRNKKPTN